MPFYADPRYNAPGLLPVAFGGTASATGTGTALLATPPTSGFAFLRRSKVTGVIVQTTIAPAGGFTGGVLDLLNGTNTIASVTLAGAGTSTSSVIADAATSTFTAGAAVTLQLRGTATSAGLLAGGVSVWLEDQELYA
jgi:hypothetical protein